MEPMKAKTKMNLSEFQKNFLRKVGLSDEKRQLTFGFLIYRLKHGNPDFISLFKL
jgi:aspartyl-tRNA synthetase